MIGHKYPALEFYCCILTTNLQNNSYNVHDLETISISFSITPFPWANFTHLSPNPIASLSSYSLHIKITVQNLGLIIQINYRLSVFFVSLKFSFKQNITNNK